MTFEKGATTSTFKVVATSDDNYEHHERFQLSAFESFYDSGRSIKTQAPIDLVIIDDDAGTLSTQTPTCVTLAASEYTPDEGDAVTMTATLDETAGSGGVQIPLVFDSQSTATSSEYSLTSTSISNPQGKTTGTVTLTITDDNDDDDDELLVFRATAASLTGNRVSFITESRRDRVQIYEKLCRYGL